MMLREFSFQDGDKSWALLVDTSTNNGQLMAYNSEGVLFDKAWSKESKHDQVLNTFFSKALEDLDLDSLKHIICIYGPGSFTGLRVSATFCKVLSLSLDHHPVIYGLSSFYSFAYQVVQNKLVVFGDDFHVFIPSIGNKTFKSSFIFDEKTKTYNEEIDLSGSKENNVKGENLFLISDLKTESTLSQRKSSLLADSKINPSIQKFSYLDFYPLFLRQSEAEEKLKI